MKTPRKALAARNRPRSLSLSFYAVVWLLMDRFDPPGWLWGVIGCLCALLLAASVYDMLEAEDVELK